MKAYLEIELPKSCCECAIKSWDGEDDVCPFSGISALSIGRQDDCPLVPVPQHGRLIDVSVLMREMHNVILEDGEDRRIFYSVIERQPTIIPAEPPKEKP